jgi:hypothetical protein
MNCFVRYMLCMCCIPYEEEIYTAEDETYSMIIYEIDIKDVHI